MTLKRVWIASPNYSGRGGSKVRLIVLHTTEGAQSYQSLGSFFGNPASQVSSHVGIDDTVNTVGEYVRRPNAAWTAGNANMVAVQGEFCTPSGAAAGWSRSTWMNSHHNMLVNAAQWVKEEAAYFGLPITALSPGQAQSSGRGVCQHKDLGAWGGGHVDCGPGFPMDYVISLAKGTTAGPIATPEAELMMQPAFLVKGAGAVTPIAVPNGAKRVRCFSNADATVRLDWIGADTGATTELLLSYAAGPQGAALPANCKALVARRVDAGDNEVSLVLTP